VEVPARLEKVLALWACLALLAAMHPFVPPGHAAHQGFGLFADGTPPASYAFAVFDADTGDFLYAISNRECPPWPPEPDAAETGEGPVFLSSFRVFRTHWDAGPAVGEGIVADLEGQTAEMHAEYCQPDAPPHRRALGVHADAGHYPWLASAVPLWLGGGSALVPEHTLGPNGFREHAVTVVGDPVQVRLWTGVTQGPMSCRDVVGWDTASVTGDFIVNDEGASRAMALCVIVRFPEETPEPGSAPLVIA